MLVIRRRAGESFRIGNDIVVQVLEVSPTRVKIGIQAPREVAVLRSEQLASEEENRRASASLPLTSGVVRGLFQPKPSAFGLVRE